MALQEFGCADPNTNLGKAFEKNPFIFIKLKLIMIILSKAKSNTSVLYSSKYCSLAIGGTLVGGDN